jgi:hypothetical protein
MKSCSNSGPLNHIYGSQARVPTGENAQIITRLCYNKKVPFPVIFGQDAGGAALIGNTGFPYLGFLS